MGELKLITAVTALATLLTALVIAIIWLLVVYTPLWLAFASVPLIVWLLVLTIVTLVNHGVFDRFDR